MQAFRVRKECTCSWVGLLGLERQAQDGCLLGVESNQTIEKTSIKTLYLHAAGAMIFTFIEAGAREVRPVSRPLDILPDVGRLSLIGHSEAAQTGRQSQAQTSDLAHGRALGGRGLFQPAAPAPTAAALGVYLAMSGCGQRCLTRFRPQESSSVSWTLLLPELSLRVCMAAKAYHSRLCPWSVD